jgi:hypothetical protein
MERKTFPTSRLAEFASQSELMTIREPKRKDSSAAGEAWAG